MITESHDFDEARDVLERVLANDRPAIAQGRALATEARPPSRRRTIEPRCEVPEWFDELADVVRNDLRTAQETNGRFDLEHADLTSRLKAPKQRRAETARLLEPYRPTLAAACQDVEAAHQQVWSTNAQLIQATALRRNCARREFADARAALDAALERQQRAELAAQPAKEAVAAAQAEVRGIRDRLHTVELRHRMALGYVGVAELCDLQAALHQWRRWATATRCRPTPSSTFSMPSATNGPSSLRTPTISSLHSWTG